MCIECGHKLSDKEIRFVDGKEGIDYREYALLGKGKNIKIRSDFADEYIQKSIEDLFNNKKLVLVLDLDNTLIHTVDLGGKNKNR